MPTINDGMNIEQSPTPPEYRESGHIEKCGLGLRN